MTSVERLRRIIHVSFGLDVGGQERLLVEFARHTDRRRLDLRFLSLGSRGELAGEIESCNWPVTALGAPSGVRPGLVWRLAQGFRRWQPDVVHTHDQRSLIYAAPAAKLARVPMVIHTRHGRDVQATRRGGALFRQMTRLVDRLVCVSGEIEALSRSECITGRRLCTILNGIDVTRFSLSGPRPDGPIVTVARLSPEKDVANLVRASALAAREAVDLRVEVAGGGPCREELGQLAGELGVADRVTFLGEIHHVPAVLARARMFVLASRSEGIPLTVLEAMARGLPVVATDVGGLPEVVIPGETGRLVPRADPVELAAAILELWRDPARGQAMGQAGRRRVEERFDVRRMVADYETLYREGRLRRTPKAGDVEATAPAPAVQPRTTDY